MNLFGIEKAHVGDCQDRTLSILRPYLDSHPHWAIAWSGGKDSTCVMTLVLHLIESGQLAAPASLTVLYADTRQELSPLAISAEMMIKRVEQLSDQNSWLNFMRVVAPVDQRFLVNILGRGVVPPNNTANRWCTRQLKVDPMNRAIAQLNADSGHEVLTLTGVRVGESAARDNRISTSCRKDDSECGQGWYQQSARPGHSATLAPILHWRVCNVWDWLKYYAPQKRYGQWDTTMLADAYGGDLAEETRNRTGCIGCPLVSEDKSLAGLLRHYPGDWGYLAPLRHLREIYEEMRKPQYRLRKHGQRRKSDGSFVRKPYRMGPLTLDARRKFFVEISELQMLVNFRAKQLGRPAAVILWPDDIQRIFWHWENQTWPRGWDGSEAVASEPYKHIHADGSYQTSILL